MRGIVCFDWHAIVGHKHYYWFGFTTARVLGFRGFQTVIRSTMIMAFNLHKIRASIQACTHDIACFNWHLLVGHKHSYWFGFTTSRVLGFGVFQTVIRSTMRRAFNLHKRWASIRACVQGIVCFTCHSIVGNTHLYWFGFTTTRVLGFRWFQTVVRPTLLQIRVIKP